MFYLKAWREAAGFPTPADLVRALEAAGAGISQSSISYWESGGVKMPKLDNAAKLALVLSLGLTAQGRAAITSDDLLHPPPVPAEVPC